MKAIVISPVNRKGGVGKSSSVFHLGGYFASRGMKVLLIDNEPQHSLTNGFIGPDAADKLLPHQTTAALFDERYSAKPQDLIFPTQVKGIDLVYGSNELDRFNGPPDLMPTSMQLAIKKFVDQVKDKYDFILIDNPPNLQLCTYSSLAASDVAYCIVQPQEFDVQGLVPVQRAVDAVLRSTNPGLRFAGYLLNQVDGRLSLHQVYESILRQAYGSKVFLQTIPKLVAYAEAVSARQPVSFYRPKSPAATVIQSVAKELSVRVIELYKRPPELQAQGRSKPARIKEETTT
ncbi:MAG: ParA family protein [Aureliella sp.]